MPSHPNTIKLYSSLNSISVMSGKATTTFLFPSNFGSLASMSPKVLDTDNLPGKTLQGISISFPFWYKGNKEGVWYTFPPAFVILSFSSFVPGLWSSVQNDNSLFLNMINLLSPTFAIMHLFFWIIAIIPHDPLWSFSSPFESKASFFKNLSSISLMASLIESLEKFFTNLCKLFLRYNEHPLPPWPSYTPKK